MPSSDASPRPPARVLNRSSEPIGARPEIAVLLAAHDRMDVLPDCLAAFAGQELDGSLELIVIDDGSTDGTAAWLSEYRPDVSFVFLSQPNAGAAAARNSGLPYVTAPLVLFVNDDTIPFPGLVQGHLDEHARLAGRRAIVLGTFEQPPEELDNAFVRVLEDVDFVFGYNELAKGDSDGAGHSGAFLYTCNASVPMSAVRAVGGFDESFPCYTEDTELGMRLETLGYRVFYRPQLRALHRHVPTFESIDWRQQAVASAHVRLFAKHPEMLERSWRPREGERIERQRQEIRANRTRERLQAAIGTLAGTNLARLERVGGACAGLAGMLERSLTKSFAIYNTIRWDDGFTGGFRALAVDGFHDLLLRAPLVLDGVADGARLHLAVVDAARERSALPVVEAWLERYGGRADHQLLLWPDDAASIGGLASALAPSRRLALRARRSAAEPIVLLDEDRVGPGHDLRLLATADAWLPCGALRDDELRELAEIAGTARADVSPRAAGPEVTGAPGARGRWPLDDPAPLRVLALPRWDDPREAAALVELVGPLIDDERIALHLVLPARNEVEAHARLGPFEAAFAQRHGARAALRVELETAVRSADDRRLLAERMHAILVTGRADADADAGGGEPPALASADDVRAFVASTSDPSAWALPRARRVPRVWRDDLPAPEVQHA